MMVGKYTGIRFKLMDWVDSSILKHDTYYTIGDIVNIKTKLLEDNYINQYEILENDVVICYRTYDRINKNFRHDKYMTC